MRVRGKVSPNKAAKMLGKHRNTVLAHCQKAMRGEPAMFKNVHQNPKNRYYEVDLAELQELKKGGPR